MPLQMKPQSHQPAWWLCLDNVPHLPVSWAQPSPGALARQGSEPRERQGLKKGEPTRRASGREKGAAESGTRPQRAEGEERGGERGQGGVEVARASGLGGRTEGRPGSGEAGMLSIEPQVFRGRGHLWTPKWREIAVHPLGLWCIGSGIRSCQPTLRKREVTPHGHLYPFLVPPAHQSSSRREPQKPPSDLPLSLCPLQPQAICVSHRLSTPPSPASSPDPGERWAPKPRSLGLRMARLQERPHLPRTPPAGPGSSPGLKAGPS